MSFASSCVMRFIFSARSSHLSRYSFPPSSYVRSEKTAPPSPLLAATISPSMFVTWPAWSKSVLAFAAFTFAASTSASSQSFCSSCIRSSMALASSCVARSPLNAARSFFTKSPIQSRIFSARLRFSFASRCTASVLRSIISHASATTSSIAPSIVSSPVESLSSFCRARRSMLSPLSSTWFATNAFSASYWPLLRWIKCVSSCDIVFRMAVSPVSTLFFPAFTSR